MTNERTGISSSPPFAPRSAAFYKWHHSFGPEYAPYLRRAIAMWSSIRQWAGAHLPALLDSLRPGASEQELQDVHVHLGLELPPAVKVRCQGAGAGTVVVVVLRWQ